MGCQSTSDDEMADIAETPTVASFVDYHNQQLQQFVTEDIGSVAQANEEIIILLNGDKSFDSGSIEIKK